ncbi:MAG: radical SAM protein [bacterium]|nr:radical SAM protein [bacterium]
MTTEQKIQESPDYLQMSLAAAMTLGFKGGRFHRGACLKCINLLITYPEGCSANCTYCGLSKVGKENHQDRSFIRVEWPMYHLDDIIRRIVERPHKVERVCLSLITNPRAVNDAEYIGKRLKENLPNVPISFLISPTLLNRDNLVRYKEIGVERIGIAVDAATPELFEIHRGREVRGPHKWDKYWRLFAEAVDIFGKDMVGSHLIVGLGETEKQMVQAFRKTRDLGGVTHLFSFFPEGGSQLQDRKPPPVSQYRRMQLCRYLIDGDISSLSQMSFNDKDQLIDFGLEESRKEEIIKKAIPFMTSGCPNKSGNPDEVSCNRPYGDCEPGDNIKSFPFKPDQSDLERIQRELSIY